MKSTKTTSLITLKTMDFKDRVAADINKVFLNANHFGSVVDIHGEDVTVTIDEDALKERNLAMIKEGKLHTDDILFYCNAKEFDNSMPRVETRMLFQDKDYMITSVKDDMGMLTITLRRYGGR